MAYTPINWQTGDTITAEKMNKMDNGWGVQNTQLFSETVTTTDTGEGFAGGEFLYGSLLSAQTIKVTFNGTDYTVNRSSMDGTYYYGEVGDSAPSFANYPFFINSLEDAGSVFNRLYTETAGTYTISANASTIEVSPNFASAVTASFDANALPLNCVSGVTHATEMNKAQQDGRLLYFYAPSGKCFFLHNITSYPMSFYPLAQAVSVDFDQTGTFVVTES